MSRLLSRRGVVSLVAAATVCGGLAACSSKSMSSRRIALRATLLPASPSQPVEVEEVGAAVAGEAAGATSRCAFA